eukprot:Em0281g2a
MLHTVLTSFSSAYVFTPGAIKLASSCCFEAPDSVANLGIVFRDQAEQLQAMKWSLEPAFSIPISQTQKAKYTEAQDELATSEELLNYVATTLGKKNPIPRGLYQPGLDKALQAFNIKQQQYFKGMFVGNHIHKAPKHLRNHVLIRRCAESASKHQAAFGAISQSMHIGIVWSSNSKRCTETRYVLVASVVTYSNHCLVHKCNAHWSGDPLTVSVNVESLPNAPLDLYILMDLSDSMAAPLATVKSISQLIAQQVSSITTNVRIGFGAFNDKPTYPYSPQTPAGCLPGLPKCGSCGKPSKKYDVIPIFGIVPITSSTLLINNTFLSSYQALQDLITSVGTKAFARPISSSASDVLDVIKTVYRSGLESKCGITGQKAEEWLKKIEMNIKSVLTFSVPGFGATTISVDKVCSCSCDKAGDNAPVIAVRVMQHCTAGSDRAKPANVPLPTTVTALTQHLRVVHFAVVMVYALVTVLAKECVCAAVATLEKYCESKDYVEVKRWKQGVKETDFSKQDDTLSQENKAKARARYKADPEKKKASVRDSYKADPEKKKASIRDSYKADPEKKKASVRDSYKADPEKKKASVRDSYKADPEKKKASVRDSYKADPEKKKASARDSYKADSEKKASVRDSYNADIESKQSAKRQRYQEDLEENRTAKRQQYQEDVEENRAAK